MDRKKNYYLGVGLALGTAIGGALMVVMFALTGNALWISFTGVGTIIGLIIGAGMEAAATKKRTEDSAQN
jgi:uncharacterized membrane protein YccC